MLLCQADREYLQLLALAAKESEEKVNGALRQQIKAGKRIDIETIRELVKRDELLETILERKNQTKEESDSHHESMI
jgi:hypothetical protein